MRISDLCNDQASSKLLDSAIVRPHREAHTGARDSETLNECRSTSSWFLPRVAKLGSPLQRTVTSWQAPVAEGRVSLGTFILVAELLDRAYAGPTPTPDYLQHECERAEDALAQLGAKRGFTDDATLAKLFALSLRIDPQTPE